MGSTETPLTNPVRRRDLETRLCLAVQDWRCGAVVLVLAILQQCAGHLNGDTAWFMTFAENYLAGFSSPVKMSRFDQAVSAVTAIISAAVSASNAARITKATVSAAWMTSRNANLTLAASRGVPAPNSPRIRMPRL